MIYDDSVASDSSKSQVSCTAWLLEPPLGGLSHGHVGPVQDGIRQAALKQCSGHLVPEMHQHLTSLLLHFTLHATVLRDARGKLPGRVGQERPSMREPLGTLESEQLPAAIHDIVELCLRHPGSASAEALADTQVQEEIGGGSDSVETAGYRSGGLVAGMRKVHVPFSCAIFWNELAEHVEEHCWLTCTLQQTDSARHAAVYEAIEVS